jgi:hypothetical protein
MFHCFYRISDNGYKKPKLPNATKERCLSNFLTMFWMAETTLFVDRCGEALSTFIYKLAQRGLKVDDIDGGSSAGSWRVVCQEALKLPDDDIVLFQEDDYLHLPGSRQALLEAVERGFPYVTLYDAPDKYVPANYGWKSVTLTKTVPTLQKSTLTKSRSLAYNKQLLP